MKTNRGVFHRIQKLLFCVRHFLEFIPIMQIFKDLGHMNSMKTRQSIDADGKPIPWYTYPIIEFLSQFDFSKKNVFEYGSGNSTLWWAKRASSVTFAEHNPDWYARTISSYPENVFPSLNENPQLYADSIDGNYDIIIIDGCWRDLCAKKALEHVKDDGIIIIDDAQRVQSIEEYKIAMKLLQSDPRFIQIDFKGFTPIAGFTKVTSMFLSRKIDLCRNSEYIPTYGEGNLRNEY